MRRFVPDRPSAGGRRSGSDWRTTSRGDAQGRLEEASGSRPGRAYSRGERSDGRRATCRRSAPRRSGSSRRSFPDRGVAYRPAGGRLRRSVPDRRSNPDRRSTRMPDGNQNFRRAAQRRSSDDCSIGASLREVPATKYLPRNTFSAGAMMRNRCHGRQSHFMNASPPVHRGFSLRCRSYR